MASRSEEVEARRSSRYSPRRRRRGGRSSSRSPDKRWSRHEDRGGRDRRDERKKRYRRDSSEDEEYRHRQVMQDGRRRRDIYSDDERSGDERTGRGRGDRLVSGNGRSSRPRSPTRRRSRERAEPLRKDERRDDEGVHEDEKEEGDLKPSADLFVWKKKNEKLKKMGLNPDEDAEDIERRKIGLQDELRRAKLRRIERDQERAEWEAEQARLAREKEAEENADWEHREQVFHSTNFYTKQAVRLREHRPTPADFLARNSRVDLADVGVDPNPPYETLSKVTVDRLKEIVDHIEEELRFIELYDMECEGECSKYKAFKLSESPSCRPITTTHKAVGRRPFSRALRGPNRFILLWVYSIGR
mmetsp:Transcript_25565/g.100946  ORF Transcript_25565/g.100946 Transcript_25565/m.100946 type:complete len:359 (-) Transcript_25565:920-1996(-)